MSGFGFGAGAALAAVVLLLFVVLVVVLVVVIVFFWQHLSFSFLFSPPLIPNSLYRRQPMWPIQRSELLPSLSPVVPYDSV